jgi:hypothetical protein
MKQTLTTFCLSVVYLSSFGQSFEGEIVYQTSFKSKIPDITAKEFSSVMSVGKNFFIKDGDFKYETDGAHQLWQLYINADNKLYHKYSNSEVLIWNDASVNREEVLSTEIYKDAAEILGYKCDEIILNCNIGIHKYYFSSKLHIDGKLYTNCLIDNWYAYLSNANAIPLKIVFDNEQVSMETTAIAVKPMILDKSIFTLPEGAKTSKSIF